MAKSQNFELPQPFSQLFVPDIFGSNAKGSVWYQLLFDILTTYDSKLFSQIFSFFILLLFKETRHNKCVRNTQNVETSTSVPNPSHLYDKFDFKFQTLKF